MTRTAIALAALVALATPAQAQEMHPFHAWVSDVTGISYDCLTVSMYEPFPQDNKR